MTYWHAPKTLGQGPDIERGDGLAEVRNGDAEDQKKTVVIVELLGDGRSRRSADNERHGAGSRASVGTSCHAITSTGTWRGALRTYTISDIKDRTITMSHLSVPGQFCGSEGSTSSKDLSTSTTTPEAGVGTGSVEGAGVILVLGLILDVIADSVKILP